MQCCPTAKMYTLRQPQSAHLLPLLQRQRALTPQVIDAHSRWTFTCRLRDLTVEGWAPTRNATRSAWQALEMACGVGKASRRASTSAALGAFKGWRTWEGARRTELRLVPTLSSGFRCVSPMRADRSKFTDPAYQTLLVAGRLRGDILACRLPAEGRADATLIDGVSSARCGATHHSVPLVAIALSHATKAAARVVLATSYGAD
jgi:hypothetical protein